MANENKNQQDELNANDVNSSENSESYQKRPNSNENHDFRHTTEAPKENPFSFKHFLRQDISSNAINGNDLYPGSSNNTNGISTTSPSKSQTTSSLNNSTGARPKIPQFQSVNAIQCNQVDSRMKRSPKFSSFDSQSSLSELADERNMHGSRSSSNCFNSDYQFPSSRSYSNYDIEPNASSSSLLLDRKHNGRRSQNNVNNTSNSSILPDFVQDHLLMESYYNNSDSPSANNMSPLSGDDFSLGNCDSQNGSKTARGPFDLTYNRSPGNRRRANATIPLDLPSNERNQRSASSDLPPDLMDAAGVGEIAVQREETYGAHNEPEITRDQATIDKMQTLPDFLSDGPIHSSGRLADVATISVDEDNQSLIMRLQQENERLRMDVEESRRIIIDLENQISHAKNLETQYNVTLAESMEQVEENLFASNQKAAEAQAQANKYKQQVRQLTMEIQNLRRENETLREGGAVGGVPSNPNINNRHFARDLRLAASSAENNLRQLLTGVENLRLIANTIENMDQFNSTDNLYLSDDSDENEGPAL